MLLLKVDLTHYQMTNFRLFRIERLCRRQFQTGRKRVEKEEIACCKCFLLLPHCFPTTCTANT